MDGRHGAAGPGIREVSAAIGEAGAVLNRPLEIDAASGGLRPKFAGAIRAGRIEERDGKLYATYSAGTERHAAV